MAKVILSNDSSGSVFGYELEYHKTDVAISDGTTQCDLGYSILKYYYLLDFIIVNFLKLKLWVVC